MTRVVASPIIRGQVEPVLGSQAGPEHDGQPFRVHDVLHDGSHDGSGPLEDDIVRVEASAPPPLALFPVPTSTSPLELLGQDVVVAHEDGVYEGQGGLLVDTGVS